MRKIISQALDFAYVICQRRLSSARYLIKTGVGLLLIGSTSLIFKIQKGDYSLLIDTASSPQPEILLTVIAYIGLCSILLGLTLELKERFFGEAVSMKRAKSIDLRSLDGAAAPTLADTFPSTIETTGLHQDLFLWEEQNKSKEQWLAHCCKTFINFHTETLRRLNSFEPQKPLALGAIAHVPHCFTLGYLVGNKRLVNYYCWQRNSQKQGKERWIDCRDVRSKGQSLCPITYTPDSEDNAAVKRIGLSIEVSMHNDEKKFLSNLNLDLVIKLKVQSQYIGNMFSDVEQANLVSEIREQVNFILTQYENIKELHISITAQCSLVMRLGADFNQNHLKMPIYVHHFENRTYPWAFCLNNQDKFDISYIYSNGEKNEA